MTIMQPEKFSRRRFLKRALLTTAAVAAPCVLPAGALGKGGVRPPSDRINMGFTGLGGQGGGHLFGGAWTYLPGGYLGRDDVQVMAVCDVRRDRADAGKARVEKHYADKFGQGNYSGCGAYQDFREMIARKDIDAVLVAVSYHANANLALLAMRAGKDVYSEKPTSPTIRAGRALVEASRAYGRVYQGGTQQRSEYGGKFRKAVELVRGGRIGRLKQVYAYQGGGAIMPPPSSARKGDSPPGVDWECYVNWLPWFNYHDGPPAFGGNPSGAHRFGWGDINWGQHHYDIVQWGVGADDTGPVEIRLQDGKPVHRYANGVEVFGFPPPGEKWDQGGAAFIGTEGRITVHRELFMSDPPELIKEIPQTGSSETRKVYYSTSHGGNFLECIRTRQKTICDAETTHRGNSVLLLGGIAMRLGRTLKWDPAKEEFPIDPEANRMLSMATHPTRTPANIS